MFVPEFKYYKTSIKETSPHRMIEKQIQAGGYYGKNQNS